MRGFAIILVVTGHAVQYNLPGRFDDNILFKVIYTFHMPLFMFISGYVAFGSFDGSVKKMLKRAKALLLPFFSWFLVGYLVQYGSAMYQHSKPPVFTQLLYALYQKPDTGLWFLWILFLNYLLLFIALLLLRRYHEWVLLLFCIALNLFLHYIPFRNEAGIRLLQWHSIFFTAAYLLAKYKHRLTAIKWYTALASLLLYLVLLGYYNRVKGPAFYPQIARLPRMAADNIVTLYNALLSFSAMAVLFFFIKQVVEKWMPQLSRFFMYTGGISLEIYSTHFYSLFIIHFLSALWLPAAVFITIAWALLFSIVLQRLIKKLPVLPFLLYVK